MAKGWRHPGRDYKAQTPFLQHQLPGEVFLTPVRSQQLVVYGENHGRTLAAVRCRSGLLRSTIGRYLAAAASGNHYHQHDDQDEPKSCPAWANPRPVGP